MPSADERFRGEEERGSFPDPAGGAGGADPSPPGASSSCCTYCGSRLDPRYYFCLECSQPYKREAAVLPRSSTPPLPDSVRIARLAPRVAPLCWTYAGVLLVAGIPAYVLQNAGRADLAFYVTEAAILVVTAGFAARHWKRLVPLFRRPGFDRLAAWGAVLLLVPLLGLNDVYHGWWTRQVEAPAESLDVVLRGLGFGEVSLVLIMAVFPAVTEEIAFRGLVLTWLQDAVKPWRAVFLSSAYFAALHFSLVSLPYLLLVGLVLGWVRWKTGSLYPPMAVHFLHNWAVVEFIGPFS